MTTTLTAPPESDVLSSDEEDDTSASSTTASSSRGRGVSIEGLATLVVAIAGFFIGLQPLRDNSFLTHLATGRLILDSGSIPTADPYSFTAHGEPWTVQSWLASVAYALAEDLGGLVGVRLLIALVTAALCVLLFKLTEPAGAVVTRVALLLPVLAIGFDTWSERPLMFGLFGLAAVHLLADGKGRAWWAVPLFAVWVNVHGSFPLGGVLVGTLLVGAWLDRRPVQRELQLLGWSILGVLVGGINPLGPKLVVFPLEMLGKMDALRKIKEWQPLEWDGLGAQIFLVLLAAAALLLATRHRRWRSIVPLVVFAVMAVTGARNLAPAAIVALGALAPALSGYGSDLGRERKPLLGLAAGVVLAIAGLAAVSSLRGPDVDLVGYPEDAVVWMEDHDLLGPDSRVVSRDFAGNYLEAHSGTDVPVFIDDRYDMYPTEVIDDAMALNHGDDGWEEVLERWDASAVLWDADTDLWPLLQESDRWEVVYEDDTWLVAVPR